MKSFLVKWEIDIEADNPIEAAKEARKIHLDGGSTATVFHVKDNTGKLTVVDLEELPLERCPNCNAELTYLEVSKQMEGSRYLPDAQGAHGIVWKPEQEQYEEEIYTCPECLSEIEDKTLEEWGFK